MSPLLQSLFALRDEAYAAFHSRLIPTVDPSLVIGIRIPVLRKFAKEYYKNPEHEVFLNALPHRFYDENMLHTLLLSQMNDFDACLEAVERFLPYIDNWAVCDILSPKVFARHKAELLPKIRLWSASPDVYTCRFGLEMLMTHFLDADFQPGFLQIAANARGDDYYVRMMVAWFFATALAKQWQAAIPFLQSPTLEPWTHNKTIQKARESFRISKQQKDYLSTLKLKNG